MGQTLAARVGLIVWCGHQSEPDVATQVAQHGSGMPFAIGRGRVARRLNSNSYSGERRIILAGHLLTVRAANDSVGSHDREQRKRGRAPAVREPHQKVCGPGTARRRSLARAEGFRSGNDLYPAREGQSTAALGHCNYHTAFGTLLGSSHPGGNCGPVCLLGSSETAADFAVAVIGAAVALCACGERDADFVDTRSGAEKNGSPGQPGQGEGSSPEDATCQRE
jgi:hypothetical protein